MRNADSSRPASTGLGFAVVAALTVFYFATSPQNHATALDSYGFAYWIRDLPLTTVPELRQFLWIAAMRVIYHATTAVLPLSDPFTIVGAVSAFQMSLAVVLLQRLLSRRLDVPSDAAWITAGAFAFSYGIWRYAAETEVYASAALLSIGLCHAAFSLETGDGLRRSRNLAALAVCGGLATLAYQPIGVLAGFALPAYIFMRLGFSRTILYLAVSGAVVFAGLFLAFLMDGGGSAMGIGSVFDTDGKPLSLPTGTDLLRALISLFQNFLSINWGFVFEPTRRLFEENAGYNYRSFLYSASFVGPGYLVFFVSLPLAALLFLAAVVLGRGQRPGPGVRVPVTALLIWLAGQAVTVLLIDPRGLEAWLPTLFPLFLLLGLYVTGPLCRAGGRTVAVALVAVFVVHNYLAGVDVLASGERDFYEERAGRVIEMTGPDDLIVVIHDWSFNRFLSYAASSKNIDAARLPLSEIREMIAGTLARGGKVVIFDGDARQDDDLPRNGFTASVTALQLTALYPGQTHTLDLGRGGRAFVILGSG
jgi:hypothetical protein